MQTLQLNIGGMACSFCAESINKAYNKVDGVEKIDVSMAHEQVLIRYQEDKVWEQELRQTILDLGYTIRDPDKVKTETSQETSSDFRRLFWLGHRYHDSDVVGRTIPLVCLCHADFGARYHVWTGLAYQEKSVAIGTPGNSEPTRTARIGCIFGTGWWLCRIYISPIPVR